MTLAAFADRILFLDNHLLVVDKPGGVLSQGDQTGDDDLLTLGKAYLKERFEKPGNVFLGLVHRLDRPVSGVMVFARTSKSASRLSDQFRRRTPQKRYVALVEGRLEGRGRAVHHLRKVGRTVEVVAAGADGAQRAALTWEAWGPAAGGTLVGVELETGRPHQIRVQLAALGHPIRGDFRYGSTTEHDGRTLALHCYHLTIEHPTRRVPLTWTTPPPPTWEAEARRQAQERMEQDA